MSLPKDLPVLVLAAGRSTRIHPVSGGLPKPLIELAGRPLIRWNLLWLAEFGISEAWVNLHYQPAAIRQALGERAEGVRIRYAHEPELLGTAGAWREVARAWDRTSLVVYGDNFMRFDLEGFLDAHRASGATATVALFDPAVHASTGGAGGRVRLDEAGRITAFAEPVRAGTAEAAAGSAAAAAESRKDGGAAEAAGATSPEKPAAREPAGPPYVNAGAYLLEPTVRAHIGPGFQDFGRNVFPGLAGTGKLNGYLMETGGFCLGVDTPERFAEAERLVRSGELGVQ